MKFQLLTSVLSAMFLIVHCVPVNIQYPERSPDHTMMFISNGGEYDLISMEDAVPNVEDPVHISEEYPIEDSEAGILESSSNINKPTNQNHKPESEEYDDPPNPKTNTRRQPSVSNFFPIMFGRGMGRFGGVPSGATAIANSFSTGKGAVATSHATAYGDSSASLKHHNENGQI